MVAGETEPRPGVENPTPVGLFQLGPDFRDTGPGFTAAKQGRKTQIGGLDPQNLGCLFHEIFGQGWRTGIDRSPEQALHHQDTLAAGFGADRKNGRAELLHAQHGGHTGNHHGKGEAVKQTVRRPDAGPPGSPYHGFPPDIVDIEIGQRVRRRDAGGAGGGGNPVQILHPDHHNLFESPKDVAATFGHKLVQGPFVEQPDPVFQFVKRAQPVRIDPAICQQPGIKWGLGFEPLQDIAQFPELNRLHLGRVENRFDFHVPIRAIGHHGHYPFAKPPVCAEARGHLRQWHGRSIDDGIRAR